MCRVLGAVLIVMGLYSVLWGKYKEYKDKAAEDVIPETMKGTNNTSNNQMTNNIVEDLELEDIESRRANVVGTRTLAQAVAISVPISPPMIAMEAPKGPLA